MVRSGCPEKALLADFNFGRSDEQQLLEIAGHLDTCPACQATLEAMSGSDTLERLLGSASPSMDTARDAAVARVLALSAAGEVTPGKVTSGAIETLSAIRDYQLLTKLGQGGMGTVYKALHTRLRKLVAIKLLPTHRLNNADAVARFDREMQAVGALDHPHLVRALDAGDDQGQRYLVMEYLAGCDLGEAGARYGPLPRGAACEVVRQAALGLQHAHEHGLVHRDVKPSNLMLVSTPQGPTTKVLDLGLALLQGPHEVNELTSSGQFMGTIDYMAPEQGESSHHVDVRADVYSLGATLYKLLTGQPPFAGDQHASLMRKLVALATQPHRPVRELRPDIPAPLAALVDQMLAKSAVARPTSAAHVAEALAPFAYPQELQDVVLAMGLTDGNLDRTVSFENAGGHRASRSADAQTKRFAAPPSILRSPWSLSIVATAIAAAMVAIPVMLIVS